MRLARQGVRLWHELAFPANEQGKCCGTCELISVRWLVLDLSQLMQTTIQSSRSLQTVMCHVPVNAACQLGRHD